MKVFNSVSDLQAASLTAGQLTQTKRYFAGQDGGGATYLIKTAVDYAGTPDGYVDHTLANTNVAVLQHSGTVTSKQVGVIESASYVFSEAEYNRAALTALLDDERISYAILEPTGTNAIYVWGSINCRRSNLTVHHKSGCTVIGRYSDPSEPAFGQAGHLFGFVDYTSVYPNAWNSTIQSELENIHYILDGKLSTEYNASHSDLHNNNCLGFANVKNCSVTGEGGIEESDHNGIAFDLDCTNCKVDLNYIRNCDSQAVKLNAPSASTDSTGIVKVREITGLSFDGSADGGAILVRYQQKATVEVGICEQPVSVSKTFVNSQNNESVEVSVGLVTNAAAIVSFSDTNKIIVKNSKADNATYGISRGASSTAAFDSAIMENVTIDTAQNFSVYFSGNNTTSFNNLQVVNCDFSAVTGTCTPIGNYASGGAPSQAYFRNNTTPATWVYRSTIRNQLDYNLPYTAVGGSSFSYDFAGTNGDFPYRYADIYISIGTTRYMIKWDFTKHTFTSSTQAETFDNGTGVTTLTGVRTGTSVAFTISGSGVTPTIAAYALSN